ncbi:MAG: hypothetical protein ACKVOO_12355 [Burkholderiaceae bacterium]
MNEVKYYTSGMGGAPVLSNSWGDLVALLDACLVTGFATRVVASITSIEGVATATISAGHTYRPDQIVTVAGCDQAEYNGEVRIIAATSNTFTYPITGTPASPATTASSISAKVAPLGFEMPYTGTHKRVYRSPNVASNRPYLRVDNSLDANYTTAYAKFAKVTMAEAMTDIDTFGAGGRAPFDPANPTYNEGSSGAGASAIVGWHKWYHAVATSAESGGDAGAGARTWVLIGDDRGFYFLTNFVPVGNSSSYQFRAAYCFTDFASLRPLDQYNTIMAATDLRRAANAATLTYASTGNSYASSLSFDGRSLMRDHTQLGNAIRAGFFALNTNNAAQVSGFTDGITFPNGPDYALLLHPTYIRQETGAHVRGVMPGQFWVHHNGSPYSDLTVIDGVAGYAGRKFLICVLNHDSQGNVARIAFDVTGPWR